MARLDFSFDDEFIKSLGTLAQIDRYAPQMIDEALPIIENKLKMNLRAHSVSGDLIRSIKIKKSKRVKNGGYYGSVSPEGKSADGTRNAEKLVYLEYGTSRQSAQAVIAKTIQETTDEVNAKMQEVFNREALNKK